MKKSTSRTATGFGEGPTGWARSAECAASLLPEFRALRIDELVQVNLDITSATTTVVGAFTEIVSYVPQIVDELPKFDVEPIKKLKAYAMAASHAHTLYMMVTQPDGEHLPVVTEGTALRELMYSDATNLRLRGFLSTANLKELKGPIGHKNVASDLQVLASIFRENFAQVAGKCTTTAADVEQAELLAAAIIETVGNREQGPAAVAATADMRTRAFTRFTSVYDQVRRALTYLRWSNGDADSIAPSLYAGRGGRRRTGPELPAPQQPPTAIQPVTPNPAVTGEPPKGGSSSGGSSGGGPFMP